ncbi:LeuA family protein [Rhodovulum sp. PH10]|uniref:LeuA family protein n=1 Tax=Rhodovulum sp. PH10 TaxID=1187851 RepID=UPI00058D5C9D|nr:pyruvate carboxyltransferase [Rhodovulum sp. PH10]
MAQEPWKSDDFFVSPWNYADEVRKELAFPKNIKVHDVTLRDGEQQTGIIFTKDDKIRIAEALAEAGVHRIEAGMPVVSPDDDGAIREIVKRNLGPEIFAFARCMKDDVKRAIDTGVKGIVMEIPSSQHLVELAYRWKMEKAIETSIESTRYAHENGLEVVFFPIDFSRAELKWAIDLIERVGKEGHMDALALVDTFGVLSPHSARYFVREVKKRMGGIRLETHFHQDFGMGVANTIMGLAEGASVMHTTVLGVGERSGNAPMEEVVMALKTLYGVDIGIDTTKLYGLANLVQRLADVKVPSNKAIVGSGLYQIESGIITSWFKNCGEDLATEVFPIRWDAVGQPPAEIVMGKGSGIDSVNLWLQECGMQASQDDAMKILMTVKQHALKTKKMLTKGEFRDLARKVIGTAAA